MALEAPLRSSTGSLQFTMNQPSDHLSQSTDSDRLRSPFRIMSSPPAVDLSSLRPNSVNRIYSNPGSILSPSDIVGPSPVTSNGTETTEIEDDIAQDVAQDEAIEERISRRSELLLLSTNLPESVRQPNPEESVSVIHAPESFSSWTSTEPTAKASVSSEKFSPKADDASQMSSAGGDYERSPGHPPRPPISTDVNPVRYSVDSATPRAQDMQDMISGDNRMRSSSTSSLEKIDEQTEAEGDDDDDDDFPHLSQQSDEITNLRTLLHEFWTLCNTLASLGSMQRTKAFRGSETPDADERAWKACWKLCQRLYDNQDDDPASLSVKLNLDLCRDFCQALFDIRLKKDELADSVLRVSFELNNHLYSAQDSRNLPQPFRERTLDFYITLCHRLMKQRGEHLGETDTLLEACWGLAEMLFNLRQNRRDGRAPDEELLRSAVEACWALCDIFRDGWTKVRPDRNTPRPNQTNFFAAPHPHSDQTGRESRQSNRSSLHSKRESTKSSHQEERPRKPPPVPETPVTEFEDTPISPQSRSPQMPNLMVLGPSSDNGRGGRWSSSASNLSSYSHSSNRTSSTATTTTATEDPNVTRAKVLVIRAAMNLGFDRESVNDPKTGPLQLQKFVQAIPAGSFGPLPSHTTLLQSFKNSILTDSFIPRSHTMPARGKKVSAVDMAKSIQTLVSSSPRYSYLRELYKWVFQFALDEAESRRNISIVI